MSLIDELLRKAKKEGSRGDIPPVLETLVIKDKAIKRNKHYGVPKWVARLLKAKVLVWLIISPVILIGLIFTIAFHGERRSGSPPGSLKGAESHLLHPESRQVLSESSQKTENTSTAVQKPLESKPSDKGPPENQRFSGVLDETENSNDKVLIGGKSNSHGKSKALVRKSTDIVSKNPRISGTPDFHINKGQKDVKGRDRSISQDVSLHTHEEGMAKTSVSTTSSPSISSTTYAPNVVNNEKLRTELLYRANTYERDGQYHEAVRFYEEVLKIQSDDYRIMNQIAYLYIKLGIPGRAIEYAEKAIMIKPDYIPAMINLAVALMLKGEAVHAEKLLLRVLDLEPLNKTAIYNMAILYENTKRFGMAEEYYKKLFSLGEIKGKEGLERIGLKKPYIDSDKAKEE